MPRTIAKSILLMALLAACVCNTVLAKGGKCTVSKPTENTWQFEIAPYAWVVNMNGDIQIARQNAHVNETAADLLKYLKGGGMLFLDANKGNLGIFFNGIYTRLSKDVPVQTADFGNLTIKATSKYGLFAAGVSYKMFTMPYFGNNTFSFEPYIGARYTVNDSSLKILNTNVSASTNQRWTDPILGARMNFTDRNWRLFLAGDIGGMNFNNQKSVNLQGILGYNPASARWFNFYLGYKYLYQKYINGSGNSYFYWNMRLFGPVLGVGFKF